MRRAKVALSVTCRLDAIGLTTGERSDAETVTLRSERGGWKRAITRWYLASRLLNLGHPLQKGECMPNLHFTILIEGSAETVFALIADLAHYDRWLPGSKAFGTITQISPLPVGLGTTYIDAGPAGTRHGEVTEYDPPTRISFHQPMQVKQRLLTGTIDIHLRHTLEPVEQR